MLGKTVETKVPIKAAMPDDKTLELKATFKIDRTKWGMNYGEGKINKEVELVAEIVLKK
jgi:polyisoprenoid-binding protein YceI